jgi:hypothetical protein
LWHGDGQAGQWQHQPIIFAERTRYQHILRSLSGKVTGHQRKGYTNGTAAAQLLGLTSCWWLALPLSVTAVTILWGQGLRYDARIRCCTLVKSSTDMLVRVANQTELMMDDSRGGAPHECSSSTGHSG